MCVIFLIKFILYLLPKIGLEPPHYYTGLHSLKIEIIVVIPRGGDEILAATIYQIAGRSDIHQVMKSTEASFVAIVLGSHYWKVLAIPFNQQVHREIRVVLSSLSRKKHSL